MWQGCMDTGNENRLSISPAVDEVFNRLNIPNSLKSVLIDSRVEVRCDTIRLDTVRYDATRHDTIRYDTIRYDTIRYDTI